MILGEGDSAMNWETKLTERKREEERGRERERERERE